MKVVIIILLVIFTLFSSYGFGEIFVNSELGDFSKKYAQKNTQKSKATKIKSSGQAAQLVRKRMGGKVLKVNKTSISGHLGYRVKIIMDDGRILSYVVDSETGRISRG